MSTHTDTNRPAPHSGGGAAPGQAELAVQHRRRAGVPNWSLSAQQRRVLATEGLTYLGTDARERPVVEGLVGIPQQARTWAVLRSGDPTDVVQPVSLVQREQQAAVPHLPVRPAPTPPSRELATRRFLTALLTDYRTEHQPEGDPARYVLVEANTNDGAWWLTYVASPEAGASYHDDQEYPELWEAKVLVDLETGQRWVARTEVTYCTTWEGLTSRRPALTVEAVADAIRSVPVGCGHADYVATMYAEAVMALLAAARP